MIMFLALGAEVVFVQTQTNQVGVMVPIRNLNSFLKDQPPLTTGRIRTSGASHPHTPILNTASPISVTPNLVDPMCSRRTPWTSGS